MWKLSRVSRTCVQLYHRVLTQSRDLSLQVSAPIRRRFVVLLRRGWSWWPFLFLMMLTGDCAAADTPRAVVSAFPPDAGCDSDKIQSKPAGKSLCVERHKLRCAHMHAPLVSRATRKSSSEGFNLSYASSLTPLQALTAVMSSICSLCSSLLLRNA